MPRYRVSYKDRDGRAMRAFVTGPSLDWAREHLQQRGATNVRVHGEDVLSPVGRNLRAELKVPRLVPYAMARRAAKRWALWIVPLLVLDVLEWIRRPPGAVIVPILLPLLTLVVIVWATLAVSPIIITHEVQTAIVWRQWDRALRLLSLFSINPFVRKPSLETFHGSQRATALAGLGRLDEAYAVLDALKAKSGRTPAGEALARSSLLITARRYAEAIPLRRQAAAMDPKFAFDAAIAMLRYGGDVEEARALLASRRGAALTELERGFQGYAEGILAIADRRYSDALAGFEEARAVFLVELVQSPPNLLRFTALIDGHRAWALAALGETEAATKLLAPFERFLDATDEALLAECRAALRRG